MSSTLKINQNEFRTCLLHSDSVSFPIKYGLQYLLLLALVIDQIISKLWTNVQQEKGREKSIKIEDVMAIISGRCGSSVNEQKRQTIVQNYI